MSPHQPPPRCRGPVARRDVLRAGALALGGVTLPRLIAARADARPPDTSVILFWMWGGPSHYETFDPKPDAPEEVRGPFRPTATPVPGTQICELFPRLARLADRYALVRSLRHESAIHNDSSIEVLTGKPVPRPDPTSSALSEHPDFGMVAAALRRSAVPAMPGYVGIPKVPFMVRPTYLGVTAHGFATGDPAAPGFRPTALAPAAGLDPGRLSTRHDLVGQLDDARRRAHEAPGGLGGVRGRALDLLTSPAVAAAFNLAREAPRTRDRYGRHLWGQSCLLARRLVEAGTAVVTVDALAPTLSDRYFSWDDHINAQTKWDLADAMRYRAPFMDQAVSALLEDLHERGLNRRVMVVAMGEFGRTPRVVRDSGTGVTGRDHWPHAYTALVAGGRVPGGTVVGATNRRGEHPQHRPVGPQDLLATLYRHLGIDPRHELHDATGRPIPLLPFGEPIAELG